MFHKERHISLKFGHSKGFSRNTDKDISSRFRDTTGREGGRERGREGERERERETGIVSGEGGGGEG